MQLNEVDEMLNATEGFVDTSDQDRFDTYEETVNAVVKKVKRVWQVWKVGRYPLTHDSTLTMADFTRVFSHKVDI